MTFPHHPFRSLKHVNFRLFWIGQLISLTGVCMTNMASSWLVYRLTGSTVLLGVVSFAGLFPAFLLSPFAGVHVDRLNKKKVVVWSLIISTFQSAGLAFLTLTNTITIPLLVGLSILQAVVDAFYTPARQALIPQLVSERADLSSAIALNSAGFHLARLVGPAIAGVIIAHSGEGVCYLIDAVSYGAVLISLAYISVSEEIVKAPKRSWVADFKDGLMYMYRHQAMRALLLITYSVCLLSSVYTILLPAITHQLFGGDARMVGFLTASTGLGACTGALVLAWTKNQESVHKNISIGLFVLAMGIAILASIHDPYIAAITLFFVGVSFISVMAGASTILQHEVENRFRGRVMSFFAMSFTGMMPLGSVGAGWLASNIGIQQTVLVSGCLLGLIAVFGRKRVF